MDALYYEVSRNGILSAIDSSYIFFNTFCLLLRIHTKGYTQFLTRLNSLFPVTGVSFFEFDKKWV